MWMAFKRVLLGFQQPRGGFGSTCFGAVSFPKKLGVLNIFENETPTATY